MAIPPVITVSIAVHNREDLTERCLRSLFEGSDSKIEVIVFDNASDSATHKMLRSWPVEVLRSEENVGYGAAHRKVLGYARGTYFVVLNNDVVVPPGLLQRLRAAMRRHGKVGIAGPESGACVIGKGGVGRRRNRGEHADYVEGSCLMVPTWLARREGLFDPWFEFAYCEDADLSLRLRQKGWSIEFTNDEVQHDRGATVAHVRATRSVPIDEFHRRNHEKLLVKWAQYLRTKAFEQTVTIRRTHARGDVLLLTPVIRAMKERNAHLQVEIESAVPWVLAGYPGVSILESRSKGRPVIDLDNCYERSPKRHIVEAYAEACGLPAAIDKCPEVYYDETSRRATEFLKGRNIAVIHPGVTAWSGRNWSTQKFATLASRLSEKGYEIAVVGDAATPGLPGMTHDFRGKSYWMTAAMMHRAKVFVGLDSLPMHMAQALMIPTVGIFGAIKPELRLSGLPFVRGVTVDGLSCLGCHHNLPPPVNQSQCHRDRVYCMEDLTVDRVMDEAEKVMRMYAMNLETSKIRHKVLPYCVGSGIDIGCGRDKITPDALGFDRRQAPEVDVVGDASVAMPYADGQFDFVYSSHALEDMTDTTAVLGEWVRILRKGGHLIVQVPHPQHYKGFNADHVHPGWRAKDLSELVAMAGCEVVEAFEDVGEDRYSTVVVGKKL